MESAGKDYRAPAKSQDFVGKGGAAERGSFSPQGGNDRYGACDDAPDGAERKGLGTPATRAAMIEKLLSAGFMERKGKSLIPTKDGVNLCAILPDMLKSPLLTAEWESRLAEIAKGKADPDGSNPIPTSARTAKSCSSRNGRQSAPVPAAGSRSMRERKTITAPTAPAALSCGKTIDSLRAGKRPLQRRSPRCCSKTAKQR